MAKLFQFTDLINQLSGAEWIAGPKENKINELHLDSRKIKMQDCFVATKGFTLDGRDFIDNAIKNGAKAIVIEAEAFDFDVLKQNLANDISVISVNKLNDQLSLLASIFYRYPSKDITVIGVTGTNGKSSTVQMTAQALHNIDGCCWTLGTLGCGPFGAQLPSKNTTSDPITLQRELARAVKYKCANAALEVSSHGLTLKRVAEVDFDIAIFTNLTRDHLDFHGTMDAYGEAKRSLFLSESLQWAVINVDDKFGKKLKKDSAITAQKLFISMHQPVDGSDLNQWIWAEDIRYSFTGIKASVFTPWGSGQIDVPLIGRFNMYNLLSVIAVLGIKLKNSEQVFAAINQIKSVQGRMELIKVPKKPLAIVDYAHSPDAIEQALKATRDHCSGKIIIVFGCGGDRDSGKRPLMAGVAEKYANHVVFTDDNPRTESAENIIADMKSGLKQPEKVDYISNRKEAIAAAIAKATEKDAVLIAGKGHENYQIYGTEQKPFSDVEVAKKILEEVA